MKKLQNDLTTPEQSKRLLELGVPEDSANCYYRFSTNLYGDTVMWDTPSVIAEYQHIEWSHKLASGDMAYIPCWSAGRLIEIFELCTGIKYLRQMDRPIVEDVKCRIEAYIYHRKFDFSKLEE